MDGVKCRQFLRHTLTGLLEHGRAILQHDIGVQLFADVNVTLHVALERSAVESAGFCTSETWLEQYLHASETFGANNDDVFVWELLNNLPLGGSQSTLGRHIQGGHHEQEQDEGNAAQTVGSGLCIPPGQAVAISYTVPHLIERPLLPP